MYDFLLSTEDKIKSIEFVPAFAIKNPETSKPMRFMACPICAAIVEEPDTRLHGEYHVKNREL